MSRYYEYPKIEWESTTDESVDRAKVFGGWLVRLVENVTPNVPGWNKTVYRPISITFVPDALHEWGVVE